MEQIVKTESEKIVVDLVAWGEALLVFIAFWVAAQIVRMVILRVSKNGDPGRREIVVLGAKSAGVAVLVLGAVSALGTAGINVAGLVAGLGLTGFALGFAFKDALSNLLAGAMILLYRPFKHGARIKVTDCEGVVKAIDLRYTLIEAEDRAFLVPNSSLLSNTITVLEKDKVTL